ncbi:hypothetical protein [Pseudomonas duriflava]|uniref:hypothetical protein n=1 Tax=Pseudomonas duriflava TaxID=459528 RepID=UPI0011A8ED58|nr:hypothetical protein [Pseudomonas duriflava]
MSMALAKLISPEVSSSASLKHYANGDRQAVYQTSPPRLLAVAAIYAQSDEEARFISDTGLHLPDQ